MRVKKHFFKIYSPTGPLNRDYDDVRNFYDAACSGIKRALKAGSKSPLLITLGNERLVLLLYHLK